MHRCEQPQTLFFVELHRCSLRNSLNLNAFDVSKVESGAIKTTSWGTRLHSDMMQLLPRTQL